MWYKLMLVACMGVCLTSGHVVPSNLTCPDFKEVQNLSIDKILGPWFVLYQLQPSQPCSLWNLSRNENDTSQLVLKELQVLVMTDSVNIKLKQFVESDLQYIDVPNPKTPGRMTISRPTSYPAKVDHFVIFDTDYENYMAIFECDEGEGFLHRRDVTILTRKDIRDPVILKRVERLLQNVGIDNSLYESNKTFKDNCEFYSPHLFKSSRTDTTLNIKRSDMSDAMMLDAITTGREAVQLLSKKTDIASFIKKSFDSKYNTTWNCLVGLDMDGTVTYKLTTFVNFTIGKMNILLFKSPVLLPDN